MCQSTGFNCEVNLDDCKSKPCDYGRCIDKINGYECACEPGYTGEQWARFSMKGVVPWALEGVGTTGGRRVHSSGTKVSDCICGIIAIERRTESNLIHTQCTNFVCSLKRVWRCTCSVTRSFQWGKKKKLFSFFVYVLKRWNPRHSDWSIFILLHF